MAVSTGGSGGNKSKRIKAWKAKRTAASKRYESTVDYSKVPF